MFFKTALLGWDLHIVKVTLVRCIKAFSNHHRIQFENLFIAPKRNPIPTDSHPLFSTSPHPSSRQLLMSFLTLSMDLPVLDILYTWAHPLCVFYNWLLSLSMVFSGFIHVVGCINPAFLFAVVVQWLSRVWLFVTPMDCSTPGLTDSQSLPKFMSIKWMMLSNHLILCHPLLLMPQSFQASVFSNESAVHIS